MKSSDLQKIIDRGENERVEFKSEKTTSKAIAKAACAFLNSNGGRIVVGVNDQNQVVGIANIDETIKKTKNQLTELISPPALWTIEKVSVGKQVAIVVEVPEGSDKPYVFEGAIYFRRGARQIVSASRNEISAIILNRSEVSQRWERQIALGAERADLDDQLIEKTTRSAVESDRWQGAADDIDGFLDAHGLIAYGGITNAALLLFGKLPSRSLPQARVRLLVMPEGKTGNLYSMDKTFEGSILSVAEQVPNALAAIFGGVTSTFSASRWQREDRPTFPMTALREGIMNALVHRDYNMSGNIIIGILPDSIQISNPGGLPEGLKPADLKRDHPSVPRNPDIAHICFLHGLIEKVGRGTQGIVEDCRKARLRDPKWQSSGLETKLTFFAPTAVSKSRREEELNERQQKILNALREVKQLKSKDVTNLFGDKITDRTVRNDLQALVEGGWLVRRGRGRGTYYVNGSAEAKK
jgi:ATP-dependent DNA helicase RecG